MNYIKPILAFFLLTFFIEAGNDRSIYRKKHGNENKVALVIGNSNYTHFSPLKNTLNDAEDMRKVLKAKGFDVLYLQNGNLEDMETIVDKFASKLGEGGVGFFYYAGHGLEIGGKNYLVPVGTNIDKKTRVKYKAFPVDMIIDEMKNSHNRLNIIVLDACRNDPFSRGGGGLAQINNAKGMYIAFATAPGEVASDGRSGSNGLFTKYLIQNINKPNLTLERVFKLTRASVDKESNGKQMPWTNSNLTGDFYFQLEKTSSTPLTPVVSSTMTDTDRAELARLRLKEKQRINNKEQKELERLRKIERDEKKRQAKIKADELAALEQNKKEKAEKEAKVEKERFAKEAREAKEKEEAKNKYALTIIPTPSDAKVQITNIKPRYEDGMRLKRGTYKIKVSKVGYESKRFTIALNRDSGKEVSLKKQTKTANSRKRNGKWITPSASVCKKNRGSISKSGVCEANWNNAKKICKASGGNLPTIKTLKNEVTRCGGILGQYNTNNSYQTCYKENGFIDSWYWSGTEYKNGSSNAWFVNFKSGNDLWYGKSFNLYVLCVHR